MIFYWNIFHRSPFFSHTNAGFRAKFVQFPTRQTLQQNNSWKSRNFSSRLFIIWRKKATCLIRNETFSHVDIFAKSRLSTKHNNGLLFRDVRITLGQYNGHFLIRTKILTFTSSTWFNLYHHSLTAGRNPHLTFISVSLSICSTHWTDVGCANLWTRALTLSRLRNSAHGIWIWARI